MLHRWVIHHTVYARSVPGIKVCVYHMASFCQYVNKSQRAMLTQFRAIDRCRASFARTCRAEYKNDEQWAVWGCKPRLYLSCERCGNCLGKVILALGGVFSAYRSLIKWTSLFGNTAAHHQMKLKRVNGSWLSVFRRLPSLSPAI